MSTENATIEPAAGFVQTPDATTEHAPVTYTIAPQMRHIKRGRHPDVTKGAFGNKRKHNGIKFRTSALISRYV